MEKERYTMDEKTLKEYLRSGETVRWSGRTSPFPLLGDKSKERIILKWVLTVAMASALLGAYCMNNDPISMGFVGLVVLISAMVIVTPWLEQRAVMGQQYFITNQRAILMTKDKTIYSMDLNEIDEVRRVSLQGEADTLVMGGIIMEDIKKQLRWRASHPKTDMEGHKKQDEALGMVFYGVRDADVAEKLLRAGRGESRKTA